MPAFLAAVVALQFLGWRERHGPAALLLALNLTEMTSTVELPAAPGAA